MRKGEQMEKTRCDKHNKYKEIKRKMETDEETWMQKIKRMNDKQSKSLIDENQLKTFSQRRR